MPTTVNPTTGVAVAEYPAHTAKEIDDKLTATRAAFEKWSTRDVSERIGLLGEMARRLRAQNENFAQLITLEMGKPIVEARAEIEKCAKTLDFYAANAPNFLAFEEIKSNASYSGAQYDPLGVVLAIMPWNYPFWQFFRFAAPALAAGNGAVLKHASNVPGCSLAMQEVVDEALEAVNGPPGLFNTLLIPSSEVKTIIEDDRIAAVTLTGSTEVGALVASQAAAVVKKQVLELGGSDAFLVLDDADVELAATTAVNSRFTNNSGQSCVSAKRFIVVESVADEFVKLFAEKTAQLVTGDPQKDATQIGPLARPDLRETLHSQVEKTLKAGAELILGGEIPDGDGNFYPPTILDHVTPQHVAFREETFGPVAALVRVENTEEAIRVANDSEYGLAATVMSTDLYAARAIATRLQAGFIAINGKVTSNPHLPFGGVKHSGYGRELSSDGIREFTNIKSLWIG